MGERPLFGKLSILEFSALLFYLGAVWFFANGLRVWRTYRIDDAFITFRYAENIAAGHGIVWNIGGERVEGYSSPLLVAILVVVALLHVDPLLFTKLLGVGVSAIVIPLVIVHFVRRLDWPRDSSIRFLALLLPGLWLLMHPTLIHAISGMETSLVLLIYSGWAILVDRVATSGEAGQLSWRTGVLLGASGFLVSMARSESGAIVVLALACLFVFKSTRQAALWSGVLLLGLLGLYLAWKWSYFGYMLPNPYYRKVATAGAAGFAGLPLIMRFIRYIDWLLIVVAAGYVVRFASRGLRLRTTETFCGLSFVFYCVFFARVEPVMNYGHRFTWHAMPFLLILGVYALHAFSAKEVAAEPNAVSPGFSVKRLAVAAPVIVVLCLASASILTSWQTFRTAALNPRKPVPVQVWYGVHERIGRAIGALGLSYETRIWGAEAGLIPYRSRISAIDLTGLNDNVILRGSPAEKERYLKANPIDIDVSTSTSGALDEFVEVVHATSRNVHSYFTLSPKGRQRYLEKAREYWYAGSYHWDADPVRQYFHVWVRKAHGDSARIVEAIRKDCDVSFMSRRSWDDYSDAEFSLPIWFSNGFSTKSRVREVPLKWAASRIDVTETEHAWIAVAVPDGVEIARAVFVAVELRLERVPLGESMAEAAVAAGMESISPRQVARRELKRTTEWQWVRVPIGAAMVGEWIIGAPRVYVRVGGGLVPVQIRRLTLEMMAGRGE